MSARLTLRALAVSLLVGTVLVGCNDFAPTTIAAPPPPAPAMVIAELDEVLRAQLARHGFTGRVAETLESRLGRPLDTRLVDLGRKLWFDPIQGLNDDNSCAGCHSPTHGFGDTQPIAIGIDNNRIVGAARSGPRNQRRSPMVLNNAFYPTLMWNSRFRTLSGDPFDNREGFAFPSPEGRTLSHLPHLLTAQAFIPATERVELAGFHFPGTGEDIRGEVLRRLNESPNYRRLFARAFPHDERESAITFDHVGRSLAEFEFSLTFADAPIDRYARGSNGALTESQKRGAILFFGRAGCVACHAVSGRSNEMFSDFREHVAGIPQLAPTVTNVTFDGPGANEDFGLEQATGKRAHRYAFRTSPLRNVALQPAFMHNGAFTRLDDAIRYHLHAARGLTHYRTDGLPPDLRGPLGPMLPVLERLDPLLRRDVMLNAQEFDSLVDFVANGLLDPAARPEQLRKLIPDRLPSGRPPLQFP